MTRLLVDIAQEARTIIEEAEADGLDINDGNVIDLLADNIECSLSDLRCALVVAGLGDRFPRATSRSTYYEEATQRQSRRD